MASVGPGNYVVVVLPVGGTKASPCIKLVLQSEPRPDKRWFLAGTVLLDEGPLDAVVRGLIEETGFAPTVDDLTLLRGAVVRISLPDDKLQHVYVH
jgi:hypothetical protein